MNCSVINMICTANHVICTAIHVICTAIDVICTVTNFVIEKSCKSRELQKNCKSRELQCNSRDLHCNSRDLKINRICNTEKLQITWFAIFFAIHVICNITGFVVTDPISKYMLVWKVPASVQLPFNYPYWCWITLSK